MGFEAYKKQITRQDKPTQAQVPYETPVIDALGQAAQMGSKIVQKYQQEQANALEQESQISSEFAQKYQQAQYASDLTTAKLDIKKKVNMYYADLMANPVQEKQYENIIQTKQVHWQKFSKEMQEYIDNIDNKDVREYMTKEWASVSEDNRANIVENALTNNIAYMAEKQKDDINELILLGEYEDAKTANGVAVSSGFWDQNIANEINDSIDVAEESEKAGKMEYKDGIKYIDNLSDEFFNDIQKAKVKEFLRNKEEENIKRYEEAKKIRDENLSATAHDWIQHGITLNQLNLELSQGGLSSLPGDEKENLRRDWAFWDNKRDKKLKGKEDVSEVNYIEMLDNLISDESTTPTEYIDMFRVLKDNDLISAEDAVEYKGAVDYEEHSHIYRSDLAEAQQRIVGLSKELFSNTDKLKLKNDMMKFANIDSWGDIRKKGTEIIGTQELSQWLNNQIKVRTDIKVENSIVRVYDKQKQLLKDITTLTGNEKISLEAQTGELIGIINPEYIESYFRTGSQFTINQMQDELASKEYGKNFDDLKEREKSVIGRNIDVLQFSKNVLELAQDELNMPSSLQRLSIHRDGYPLIQHTVSGNVYALKVMSDDPESGNRIFAWYTVNEEEEFQMYKKVENIPEDLGEEVKYPFGVDVGYRGTRGDIYNLPGSRGDLMSRYGHLLPNADKKASEIPKPSTTTKETPTGLSDTFWGIFKQGISNLQGTMGHFIDRSDTSGVEKVRRWR